MALNDPILVEAREFNVSDVWMEKKEAKERKVWQILKNFEAAKKNMKETLSTK